MTNHTNIEELIDRIEHSFEKFFDLVPFPNIKKLNSLSRDIDDINKQTSKIITYCDRDQLSDASKSAEDLKYLVSHSFSDFIDKQTDINEQYINAYASLKALFIEVLNKENIDITKYSNKISKDEYDAYIRKNKINDILNG